MNQPAFKLPLPAGESPTTMTVPTVRAQAPGGAVLTYAQSQSLTWFERTYRALPPTGMYSATPSKPVSFTLGSYRVPVNQVLIVLDHAFDIYRFSGLVAGDFVPIEANRLSTQVGWDITASESTRDQDLGFQLIPAAPSLNQPSFQQLGFGASADAWQFEVARQVQNQGQVPAAASMLPQRHTRPGLMKVSSNYVVRAGSTIDVKCNVIRRIPMPIGFFEGNICGILMPQNVFLEYQKTAVPYGNPQVNKLPGMDSP